MKVRTSVKRVTEPKTDLTTHHLNRMHNFQGGLGLLALAVTDFPDRDCDQGRFNLMQDPTPGGCCGTR